MSLEEAVNVVEDVYRMNKRGDINISQMYERPPMPQDSNPNKQVMGAVLGDILSNYGIWIHPGVRGSEKLFITAHELAHICSNEKGLSYSEEKCSNIAAELILSESNIRDYGAKEIAEVLFKYGMQDYMPLLKEKVKIMQEQKPRKETGERDLEEIREILSAYGLSDYIPDIERKMREKTGQNNKKGEAGPEKPVDLEYAPGIAVSYSRAA